MHLEFSEYRKVVEFRNRITSNLYTLYDPEILKLISEVVDKLGDLRGNPKDVPENIESLKEEFDLYMFQNSTVGREDPDAFVPNLIPQPYILSDEDYVALVRTLENMESTSEQRVEKLRALLQKNKLRHIMGTGMHEGEWLVTATDIAPVMDALTSQEAKDRFIEAIGETEGSITRELVYHAPETNVDLSKYSPTACFEKVYLELSEDIKACIRQHYELQAEGIMFVGAVVDGHGKLREIFETYLPTDVKGCLEQLLLRP